MKKSTLLLVATLAANVALAGYLVHLRDIPGSSTSPAGAKSRSAPPGQSSAGTDRKSSGVSPGASAAAFDPGKTNITADQWQTLLAGDLKALVDRLRAAGFPESAISLIVNNQVRDRFHDQFQAVYGFSGEIPPFWKPEATATSALLSPDRRAAQQALSKQMNEMVQAALGTSPSSDLSRALENNPDVLASLRRQYGDLSLDKITAIQDVSQKFSQAQSDLLTSTIAGGGTILPEDRAKLTEIDQQRRAAIAALLTPDELEAYDMRSSSTASQVRNQLTAFNPTEDEFKAIYRLQKAFDDSNPPQTGAINVQQAMDRQQRQTALQDEIAASLPPDRAADYRLSLLPGAANVPRLVARLDLPDSATMDILAVQKDAQDQVKEIQASVNQERTATMTAARGAARGSGARGADLTAAVNAAAQTAAANANASLGAQLGQVNQDVAAKLTKILGPSGFEAYKSYGGAWMQQLTPMAARGAAVPGAAAPAVTPAAAGGFFVIP